MKKLLKKHGSNIALGAFLLLMLFPQTRMPIQVFIQRMISFSPSTISEEKQKDLVEYDMIFEDNSGQKINLNQSKGNVIIVNFWATWCPPCVAEMPDFQALYADYQNRVDFFFITQDDWKLIDKFETKRNYQLPYFRLIEANPFLNYQQLPTTYVIDKSGKIIVEKTGVADWNSDNFRATLDDLLQH